MFDKGESNEAPSDSLLANTVSCAISFVKADRVQGGAATKVISNKKVR